ncbi:MAG: hypothetical protein AB1391_02975 [Candidatus Micrarchaeota archaeon]
MDIDKLTKDTIENGGVLAFIYFDLHASKKETLQELGAAVVQKILGEEGVVYALGEIDEPIENNNLLSSSIEVKILVKGFQNLAKICGNYSPFSIEIIRPNEIKMSIDKAHATLMDISTNNYELKKLVLEKVYTKDDLEKFKKTIDARIQIGKKLLENLEKKEYPEKKE